MTYIKKKFNLCILHHRIVQATQKKQPRKVRDFQRLFIKSLLARIKTLFMASHKVNKYPIKNGEKNQGIHSKTLRVHHNLKYKFWVQKPTDWTYFLHKFILKVYKKILDFFMVLSNIYGRVKEKKKTISFLWENKKNSIFFIHWHSAISPVIDTLLTDDNWKYHHSWEIIQYLNMVYTDVNSTNLSTPPHTVKNGLCQSQTIPWVLKLKIKGVTKDLNKFWLAQTFPLESVILNKNLEQYIKKKCDRSQTNNKLRDLNLTHQLNLKTKFEKKILSDTWTKQEKSLFDPDVLNNWKTLEFRHDYVGNFFKYKTNFENFFVFSLLGLKNYLKKVISISIGNNFYFSECIQDSSNSYSFRISRKHSELSKKILFKKPGDLLIPSQHKITVFYYPQYIYITGLNRRYTQRIAKLISFFFQQRGLEVDFKKTKYFNIKKGLNFLGLTLKKTQHQHLIVFISKSFQNHQKKEIKWLLKKSTSEPFPKVLLKFHKKIQTLYKSLYFLCLFKESNHQSYKHTSLYQKDIYKNYLYHIDIYINSLDRFINLVFCKFLKKRHTHRSNSWIYKKYWNLNLKPRFNPFKKTV